MSGTNPRSRSAVVREFGHPWPWTVEAILAREFDRHDGDVRALAAAFGCHPDTVDSWVRRFGLREGRDG
ncbi:MAG: helix-turn-helix domain-containing protein [Halobacteriales archaeon]